MQALPHCSSSSFSLNGVPKEKYFRVKECYHTTGGMTKTKGEIE